MPDRWMLAELNFSNVCKKGGRFFLFTKDDKHLQKTGEEGAGAGTG